MPVIRIIYLSTNQAWAVTFGGDHAHPNDTQLLPIDGRFLFSSKEQLDEALKNVGLVRMNSSLGEIVSVLN